MHCNVKTKQFTVQYLKTDVENLLLWESHCHAQFEIIVVIQGNISIVLEGQNYRLSSGQIAILAPLCYHTIKANQTGTYERVTALFDWRAVPDVLHERFRAKLAENVTIFHAPVDALSEAMQADDKALYAPLVESMMVQYFYACIQAEHKQIPVVVDETLQKILTYIDAHLWEKILLDDLARHTARSKSTVCHMFQEKMRISPKQYILQKKLALAARLIQNGTPPTVAASQVGYDNYSSFFRVYRKHFGTSPSGK